MKLTADIIAKRNKNIKDAARRRYFFPLGKDMLGADGPAYSTLQTDDKMMIASAVISTPQKDRGGDIMNPMGCKIDSYKDNPIVLFGHGLIIPHPIGQAREGPGGEIWVYPEKNRVWAKCRFSESCKEGKQFYGMVKEGVLNSTSVGWHPRKAIRLGIDHGAEPGTVQVAGWDVDEWDLLEFSWVPVGMNPATIRLSWQADRIASIVSNGKYEGEPLSASFIKALLPYAAPRKSLVTGGWRTKHREAIITEGFNVEQSAEPARKIYDWLSKYLNCRVRDIYQTGKFVPSVRLGSFMSGLKNVMAKFTCEAIRNFHGDGSESPPRYKNVQLNSRLKDDFLMDGTAFYKDGVFKFVVRHDEDYGGLALTFYTTDKNKAVVEDILTKANEWATENNFLKGEAFSLSGDFIQRTVESWNDVFLEDHNKTNIRRVVDLFNTKQKSFANRGLILTGPPGTGKTLSGRIIRNTAKGSFIWISARDFTEFGSSGGMSFAFELGKELSPAILFMEDVDNWLNERTIDLIKTEMDGISRSSGVLTILTTNFPERLPDALIDRPGRFHDVLKFDLPTANARRQMLTKWLAGYSFVDIDEAVKELNGYSGAHVWELSNFVNTLKEHDGLSPSEAVKQALQKIKEQRELINQLQHGGAHYDRRKSARILTTQIIMNRTPLALLDSSVTINRKAMGTISDTSGGSLMDNTDDMEPQAVRIPKQKFPDETDAKKWAEGHSYKTDKPVHTDTDWVYEQFDAKEMEGDPREIDGEDGVKIVAGKHKSTVSPIADEPSPQGDSLTGDTDGERAGATDPASEDGKADEVDDIEDDGDPIEPKDDTATPDKKPGHIALEQLEEIIDILQEILTTILNSVEKPEVLELVPEVTDAIDSIDKAIAACKETAYGVKKGGAHPTAKPVGHVMDAPDPDDKPDDAKAFISMWRKAKAANADNEALSECLQCMREVYRSSPLIPMALKRRMKQVYWRAKGMRTGRAMPPNPDLTKLLAEAFAPVAGRVAKLEENTNQLVGAV